VLSMDDCCISVSNFGRCSAGALSLSASRKTLSMVAERVVTSLSLRSSGVFWVSRGGADNPSAECGCFKKSKLGTGT